MFPFETTFYSSNDTVAIEASSNDNPSSDPAVDKASLKLSVDAVTKPDSDGNVVVATGTSSTVMSTGSEAHLLPALQIDPPISSGQTALLPTRMSSV